MNAGDLCVIGLLMTSGFAFLAAGIAEWVYTHKLREPKRDDYQE